MSVPVFLHGLATGGLFGGAFACMTGDTPAHWIAAAILFAVGVAMFSNGYRQLFLDNAGQS